MRFRNRLGLGMGKAYASTPSAIWTPLNVSSATLISWHDAIDSTVVSSPVLDSVSDLSGNGYTGTEGNATRQGTLNATALNGKPAFVFASTKSLELGAAHAAAVAGGTNKPWSMWTICSFSGLTAAITSILHGFGSSASANPFHLLVAGTGASQVWDTERRGDVGGAASVLTGSAVANATKYIIAIDYDGANTRVRANGVDVIASAPHGGTLLTLNSSKIHGWQTGAGGYFTGAGISNVGATLFFSGALSAGDDANLYAYLNAKW